MRGLWESVRLVIRPVVLSDSGQGMLEYGLIIALVALLVIGVLIAMNGGLKAVFNRITGCLNNAAGGTSC